MTEIEPLTVRMRRVCMELRRLRKEKGLSGPDVERVTGIPPSTLSRVENSERAIKRDDLTALLVVYGVPRPVREAITALFVAAAEPGLLDENDLKVHEELATWVGFEQDAVNIRNYEQFLVPGLAQTLDYARAVITSFGIPLEPDEVDRRVAARIARQALLRRDDRPKVTVLLHEAALRQDVGGADVMRDQLRHLEALTLSGLVELRIVPDGIGGHPGLDGGPFVILDFAGLPSLAHVEHKVSSFYLEETDKVNAYKVAFNGILAVAHGVRDSVELLHRAAESP